MLPDIMVSQRTTSRKDRKILVPFSMGGAERKSSTVDFPSLPQKLRRECTKAGCDVSGTGDF